MLQKHFSGDYVDYSALLCAAGKGDRNAFNLLATAITPQLRHHLQAKSNKHIKSLIEDIIQETLLNTWKQANSFDPNRSSAVTFIHTIATRRLIDRIRHETRRPCAPNDKPQERYYVSPEPDDSQPSFEGILAACPALSKKDTTVLNLIYGRSVPAKETSTALDETLLAVKGRRHKALVKLRRALPAPAVS